MSRRGSVRWKYDKSNLQMSTAGCADKRSDCHVDICWSSLPAINTETIMTNTDNFT